MKRAAIKKFRKKISGNEPVYGLWVTLESGSITEIAVALGLDFVVVDAEHGHLDWGDVLDHIRAGVRSDTVILVRIAELQEGLIKRVLDIGADGVIIPHIETTDQLNQAMSFARFPPAGIRGIGAERATCWGQNFVEHVNEAGDILVIPLVESVKGGENIKDLVKIKGPEIFFFGPADYAASAGYAGQWDVPSVNEQISAASEVVISSGKACGIVATTTGEISKRAEEGFRMFAIGFDAGLIIKGLKQTLNALGYETNLSCDLIPGKNKPEPPPPGYEPDRMEGIYATGKGKMLELAPGVVCEALVGEHTGAVNLFTAIVTFAPGQTVLPSHTHSHAESITLLSGSAVAEVAGRSYILASFDNITIPKECIHSIKNNSADQQAVFHIAMPVTAIERTWAVNSNTVFIQVPDDFNGHLGPERITRHQSARRYPSGPNTEFIDYFNEMLIPGIGMSGGYALFHPGGRLPAHIHDFDESICITEGEAKCFVEGRQYVMFGLATAMQPRGRVHYFINESDKTMSMIWVYAGPMPERIEVSDEYATTGISRNK